MSAMKLKDIFEDDENALGITKITGKSGLMREICSIGVQRYTEEESFWDRLIPDSVLVVAPLYLSNLACNISKVRNNFFQHIISSGVSCLALSETILVPDCMQPFSGSYHVPIFASFYDEFLLESRLKRVLREKIENIISMHGALVNVFGHGIIITGESGSGKTECACKLTERGHAWIADDAVEVERRGALLYGRSHTLVKHLIATKSTGIIDAKQHFCHSSIWDETVIDLMIEFQKTRHAQEKAHDDHAKQIRHIMGVTLPCFGLPVFPRSTNTHIRIENIARTLIRERGNS